MGGKEGHKGVRRQAGNCRKCGVCWRKEMMENIVKREVKKTERLYQTDNIYVHIILLPRAALRQATLPRPE